MMPEQPQLSDQNQSILNAIGGLGAASPTTTLSTGMDSGSSSGMTQMPGMPANPVQQQTQQMMQPAAFNPVAPSPYQPQINHGIGKDQWGSRIGLDQQAIMSSLGLGGA